MFGLSWGELLVVAAIALIVFGPDELPKVAKTIMNTIRGFQKQSHELRREVYNAVYTPAEEIKKDIVSTLTTTEEKKDE